MGGRAGLDDLVERGRRAADVVRVAGVRRRDAWWPTDQLLDEIETWPEPFRASGPPNGLPSTANWTVPVGMPEPGRTAATVAVIVTSWAASAGLWLLDRVVVVCAWLTWWLTGADAKLAVKFESPP